MVWLNYLQVLTQLIEQISWRQDECNFSCFFYETAYFNMQNRGTLLRLRASWLMFYLPKNQYYIAELNLHVVKSLFFLLKCLLRLQTNFFVMHTFWGVLYDYDWTLCLNVKPKKNKWTIYLFFSCPYTFTVGPT